MTRAALLVACLLGWASPALAQAPDAAELHRQGLALLEAGKVDEACAKLGASVAAERAVAPLADLARCHELQGKIATAYTELVELSVLAEKVGDADRATRAREGASRLAPRLSKLRVEVVEPIPGLVVKRDGVVMTADQLGALAVVDPGLHVVTAEAPGYEPFRAEVRIGADADAKGVLVPRMKKPAAKSPPAPKPPVPPPPAGDGRRGTSTVGIVGFVGSGVGFVGLVIGTIFGVQTLVEVNEAEEDERLCPNKRCTPLGRLAIDEAETKGIVSTVTLSVGGAALATGVVLLVVDGLGLLEDDTPKKAAITPWAGPDGGGVGVSVAF